MIRQDDRAVTSPLEYVYTFAIAAILVTGLIIAATNAAGDQRQRTVEGQMEVVAQQVAGSLEKADGIVRRSDGDPSQLEIQRELPNELLGRGYSVRISQEAPGARITVSSPLATDDVTAMAELGETTVSSIDTVVDGGDITIRFTGFFLEVIDE